MTPETTFRDYLPPWTVVAVACVVVLASAWALFRLPSPGEGFGVKCVAKVVMGVEPMGHRERNVIVLVAQDDTVCAIDRPRPRALFPDEWPSAGDEFACAWHR